MPECVLAINQGTTEWLQQQKRCEARLAMKEIVASFTEGFDWRDLRQAQALLREL